MCTWNKRHPDLFRLLPGEHPVTFEKIKEEESGEVNEEKTSVERQPEFLHHLHV